MEFTLETVRNVLCEPFGRDSFAASFITSVEVNQECATACIDASGRMQYNPEFTKKWVQNKCELFCLIAHELCHCVFRHSAHGYGELENFGEDALINAFLTRVFPVATGEGALFKRFYESEGIEGLLRPESNMGMSRYQQLYSQIYCGHESLSSGEIIQTLRILTPHIQCLADIVLLGSHDTNPDGFSEAAIEGIADDIGHGISQAQAAGRGGALVELFRERIRSAVSLRRSVLRKYTTDRRIDRFLAPLRAKRQGVSPVPIRPTKRELVLLSAGMPPVYYKRPMQIESTTRTGLAVYLDVSGSVQAELPKIVGILSKMRDVLQSVYLFSTKVEEITFQQLLEGRIKTTYGTSFDCVAESILNRRYRQAVLFTDGFASLSEQYSVCLQREHVRFLTVLFGTSRANETLRRHGEAMSIEEAAV